MSSKSDNLIRRNTPQFVMSDISSMAPDLTGACGNEEMTDRQTFEQKTGVGWSGLSARESQHSRSIVGYRVEQGGRVIT